MRVLLCGPAGVRKEDVSSALIHHADAHHSSTVGKHPWIRRYSLESEIKVITGGTLQSFLDNHDSSQQRRTWSKAFMRLFERLNSDNPFNALIEMHLVFHREGHLFSCADWDMIAKLHPSVIVTLIDDVYDCDYRLRSQGQSAFPGRKYPTWHELLLWRSAEIQNADQVARNLFLNPEALQILSNKGLKKSLRTQVRPPLVNILCGVKHPVQTLYRLLFSRFTLPVYASFPITRPRGSDVGRQEVDNFRQKLHSQFATLDPLALDERRAVIEMRSGQQIQVRPTQRWPMGLESMVEGCPEVDADEIAKNVEDNLNIIDRHIRYRDYALINAIIECRGALVAYRPFWGSDKIAGGVNQELTYAAAHAVRLFSVDDPGLDRGETQEQRNAPGPLDMEAIWTSEQTTDNLISKHITEHANLREEALRAEGCSETWECPEGWEP